VRARTLLTKNVIESLSSSKRKAKLQFKLYNPKSLELQVAEKNHQTRQ
jgi:hypothetical protein